MDREKQFDKIVICKLKKRYSGKSIYLSTADSRDMHPVARDYIRKNFTLESVEVRERRKENGDSNY